MGNNKKKKKKNNPASSQIPEKYTGDEEP